MALVLADRVNETTTTAGTGTLTLAGAVSGYQSFSVIGNANTTYYTIVHQTANEWEVGIGTYTSAGTTLSRDTVLASSAGGTTKVTFSAGTKFVFCDYPAGKAIYQDASGNVGVGTTSPVSRLQVSGTTPALTLSDTSASAGSYSNLLFRNTDGLGTAYNIGSVLGLTTANGGNGALTFYTAASNSNTEKMRITAAGNVGIGTTTPSAFSGYRWLSLDAVNGSGIGTRVNAVDAFWLWSSATDTRFEDLQNKPLLFLINSSEKMRIDTSGNVGIGTSSPGTKLDVNGTVRIRAGNTLYFQNAAADANGTITASGGSGSSDLAINASGGNVGIGTSSPGAKLQVNGSGVNVAKLVDTSATGYSGLTLAGTGTQNYAIGMGGPSETAFSVANKFFLYDGLAGAMRMVVDSSGNLGIGTSSPFYKLSFAIGTNQVVGQYASSTHVAGNVGSLGIGINDGGGAASGVFVYNTHNGTYSSQDIRFLTAQGGVSVVTERMRIDSSGYVGIGTTSPSNPLTVSSDISAQVRINAISANVNARLTLNASGTGLNVLGTTGAVPLAFFSGSTEYMRLDTSGNLGLGVAPSAWATYPALQVSKGSLWGPGSSFYLSANLYYDGTNRRYINSAYASEYEQASGQHIWLTAASGTAGAIVSLTQSMTLDASGNLGIGTTSPGNKLTVNGVASAVGMIQVTGTPGASQGVLKAQAGSGATLGYNRSRVDLLSQAGTAGWSVYNYGDAGDLFAIAVYGGSDALNITQAGNVGIGTSSPSYKLDVNGAINLANGVYQRIGGVPVFATSGGYTYYYGNTNGIIWRNSADTVSQMSLDSSGNLGLGVTPSAWDTTASRALQLNGGSLWGYSTSQINLMQNAYYDAAGNFVYVNTAAASGYRQISGTHRWTTAASGTAGTTATFTTSMLIDGSGNLGIGTTSPSYKLHVSNGGAAGVEINPTGGINSGAFLQCYNRSTSVYVPFTTYASEMYWAISGSEKMRLDTSGNLGIGVAPTTPFQVQRNGYNTTAGWYSIARIINTAGSKGLDLGYNNGNNNATLTAYSNGTASGFEFWRWTGSAWEPSWIMDSSGNLGIGTTSPTAILHAKATNPVLRLEAATDSGYVDYTTTRLQLSAGGGAIYFVTGNTERARIDSSGNLLVGGTTQYGAAKITLTGAGGYLSLNTTVAGYTLLRGFDNGTERWSIGQIGFGGADGMAFYTGTANTERMRIDSSGNVGVGTGSPAGYGKLAVVGGQIGVSQDGGTVLGLRANAQITTVGSYNASGSSLVFQTNASGSGEVERARIDSSGNVGIGTSSPGQKLTVQGGLNVTSSATLPVAQGSMLFSYESAVNRCYMGDGTGYRFAFSKRAASVTTDLMTLNDSGNLGIGSTSPSYKLVVSNAGAAGFEVDPVTGTNGGTNLLSYDRSAGSYKSLSLYATDIRFYGGGVSESARIDSSGNLLVGTTTASFNSSNSTFFYQPTGYWVVNHANGTSTGTRYIGFGYNTGEIGSITQSGTTGVLYNITSDYRLKEFVAPVTNSGERIDALNPVEFDWKSDGSRARGFFAHEFQQVYANSVTGEKDAVDADGNPVYQTMQASTAEVIADLVAEIKSLRQRVAQLEVK